MTLHVRVSQLTMYPTEKSPCELHARHADHHSALPLKCQDNGLLLLTSDSVFTCPLSADGFIDFALSDGSSELAILRLPASWLPRDCVVREAFHMRPIANELPSPILFLDIHRNDSSGEQLTAPLSQSVPTRQRVPKFSELGEPIMAEWSPVILPKVPESAPGPDGSDADIKARKPQLMEKRRLQLPEYARQLDGFDPEIPARAYQTMETTGLHVLEDFSFFPTNEMVAGRYLAATWVPVVVKSSFSESSSL
jgi:hypothetical protein